MAFKLVDTDAWKKAADTVGKLMTAEEFRDSYGVTKTTAHVVKKVKAEDDPDALDLEFVISTDSVDRMHDRVMQKGINLTNYKKNPVVLWAHNSWTPPIARAIKTTREKLEGKRYQHVSVARFMPRELNPFSNMIYEMCEKDFLRASSIGVRVLKATRVEDEARPFGYDFDECDLLEWSVVPIPANPEALIRAHEEGINTAPLKEWAEKILDSREPIHGLSRTEVEKAWEKVSRHAIIIDLSKSAEHQDDDDAGADEDDDVKKKGANGDNNEDQHAGISLLVAGKPVRLAAGGEVSFRVGDDGELELSSFSVGSAEEDGESGGVDDDSLERDATNDEDIDEDKSGDGEEEDDDIEGLDMSDFHKSLADAAKEVMEKLQPSDAK